jgi:hypothetical protein
VDTTPEAVAGNSFFAPLTFSFTDTELAVLYGWLRDTYDTSSETDKD